MKSFKRKLAGFLIFAMVLGIMTPGMTAQAAEIAAKPTVTIDYANEIAKIAGATTGLSYTTLKKATDDITSEKLDWEECETEVDLSWVAKKKDAYLVFRAENASGSSVTYEYSDVVTLKAQRTALKVALVMDKAGEFEYAKNSKIEYKDEDALGSDDTGYLLFYTYDKKAGKAEIVSAGSIEMRKGTDGKWSDLGTETDETMGKKLNKYLAKGATLYFRQEATDAEWVSKEVKFSYKKQAKAPSVKLDVTKNTISLKKGQEYRVVLGESKSEWFNVELKHGDPNNKNKVGKITVAELYATSVAGITVDKNDRLGDAMYNKDNLKVQVRTAGTTKAVPSKIATVAIKTVDKLDQVSGSGITYGFVTPYDDTTGIALTNESKVNYEVAVTTSGESITADTKWTKLAAQKDGSKPKTIKFTKYKVGKTTYDLEEADVLKNIAVFVRVQGDKSDKTDLKLAGKPATLNSSDFEEKFLTVTGAEGTGVAFTAGTAASPASITVEVTEASEAAIKGEITVNMTGVYKKSSSAKPDKIGKIKVEKMTVKTLDKGVATGVIKYEIEKEAVAGETATFTFKYEEVEFKVTIKVVAKKN